MCFAAIKANVGKEMEQYLTIISIHKTNAMIKSNVKFLLACLVCSAAIESLSASKLNSYALSGKRKPLISRDVAAAQQNYKRTKRQTPQSIQEFQEHITKAKWACAKEMGFLPKEVEKSLLYEENPTNKEKCLMQCVLKRIEVMDKNNQLSTPTIGRIAEIISNNNALIISIAMASAENCKKSINAREPCEAAHQINKCIAKELHMRRIKLMY